MRGTNKRARGLARQRPAGGVLTLTLALGAGLILGACSEVAAPDQTLNPAPFLTGRALAMLGTGGELSLSVPDLPQGAISPDRAKELATALVKSFGVSRREYVQARAGRTIDLGTLRPQPRVLYVETPFQAASPDVDIPTRARLGPAYIVTFNDSRGPALAVSVSVFTGDHWIDEGGIRMPKTRGNQFTMIGLPLEGAGGAFIQPELAVELVARASGARVTEVPQLVWRGLSYLKHVGSWRMTLDRDVSVRLADGKEVVRRQIYVEPDGSFRVASGETRPALLPDSELSPKLRGRGIAAVRSGYSDVLVAATVSGPGEDR